MLPSASTANILDFWTNRIKWGIWWGVRFAMVFGGFGVILRVLDGPHSFREHGTTLSRFLGAYAVDAVIGGVIVGIARPLLSSQTGSGVIGLIVGAIIGFTLAVFNHEVGWTFRDLLLPGTFAVCGCGSGILINRKARQLGRL